MGQKRQQRPRREDMEDQRRFGAGGGLSKFLGEGGSNYERGVEVQTRNG